jgi:hypothetical protein
LPVASSAPVINAPLESIATSSPATAATVVPTAAPIIAAPVNTAPVINAPLETIAKTSAPSPAALAPATAASVVPTVVTIPSAPASAASDDSRVGPPIAQNATHEVVPVKEIEEKAVQKVDPETNEVKTEIVKMEVVKNKAVEKGTKVSKDGSETKTQDNGAEIVTVKKKKKSAVKMEAPKAEAKKEKEIEITTNDDDTDDEVVKKIEAKIGKKIEAILKKEGYLSCQIKEISH